MHYTPMETVVRFLPMSASGITCNMIVGFVAARVPIVWLVGALVLATPIMVLHTYVTHTGVGSAATTTACLLFAIIDPATTYWAYAFVASVVSAMGVDFIFSAGTLFIAKYSPPHEQSVAAALFSTMTRVRLLHFSAIHVPDNRNWSTAGYRSWRHCVDGCFQ